MCLLLAVQAVAGCSDNLTGFQTDEVSAEVKDNGILVSNKTNKPVYYFAVEAETAAVINWAPVSRDENKIESGSNKFIPFSDIYGFEEGDEILFYYWQTDDPSPNDIQNLLIDTDT